MTFGSHAIAHGDVLATLRELPSNEFDGMLSDPPYGLSFMGKRWDYDVPSVEVFREILRVLKPGAPLIFFGGTRTFHRMACNAEDAGLELRDCLAWMYGSGFPKGVRVDQAIWERAEKCLSRNNAPYAVQTSPVLRLIDSNIVVATARILPEGAPVLLMRIGRVDGSGVLMATSLSASEEEAIASNTILSWRRTSAADYEEARTFTIETKSETTTASRISSLLTGLSTYASTIQASPTPKSGEPAFAYLVDRSSDVVAQRSSVIPVLTALEPATCEQWHGHNLALKPAWEPALLARKPMDGTVAENVARWGCGALAIDATRIGTGEALVRPSIERHDNTAYGKGLGAGRQEEPGGRWPANVCLDENAAERLDAEAGNRPSTPYRENTASGAVLPLTKRTAGGYSDDGGASRFFYCAKVSKREREHGCDALPLRSAGEVTGREDESQGLSSPRAGAGRGAGARNHHPTLKPIALTTWLARLILPPTPNATLLVPYSGAGSEIIGALRAGWSAVFGIEGEAEFVDIAHARIAAWAKGEP